ncbi:unnamed protein product [Anisakis simplex]|uniref:DNA mismatch repair protein n=1 Tax=Anisakis simplex TaxID=6269 RepID=A0A0M3JTA8_ANISI|nr:unnamed protein product [Anisakis simplex]
MSSNRKQTSLFSFFSKANVGAKEDGSSSRPTVPPEVMKPRENVLVDDMSKGLAQKWSKKLQKDGIDTPKRCADEEDLACSPIKSSTTPKRRRVVLSSDSESDNDATADGRNANQTETVRMSSPQDSRQPEPRTPTLFRNSDRRTSTPRSAARGATTRYTVSGIAQSFIDSFRANEEDMDVSNVSTSTLDRTIYQVNEHQSNDVSKKETKKAIIDDCESERFPHLDFEFLQPNKIRDADGRRTTDPDYCPRTLYVPDAFLKQQTPGHRQWWLAKSAYFDTVLFFKVGKFYEMYHMDAVIGVENLNLTYMRGKFAHCGFPEVAYGRFADQLVSRGYKVARVEQTETPSQLEERNKVEMNREKVVRREICRITSAGTRTYGVLDSCDGDCALDAIESTARHLLAFVEKISPNESTTYGVCFIDTSVGHFYIGEFVDDSNRSSIRTLFAHYQPSQILYQRGRISSATQSLLNSVASAVIKEALIPNKEFPEADCALKMLANKLYLGDSVREWPQVVRDMLVDANALNPQCAPQFREAMAALGAVLWYLKRSLIDVDMITMHQFDKYIPPSLESRQGSKDSQRMNDENRFYYNICQNAETKEDYWRGRRLVLDGVSLYNLNIVPPLDSVRNTGLRDPTSSKYSLYNTINKCMTPFGKRLLRQWVCTPSCDADVLRSRQDAIEWLMSSHIKAFVLKATDILRKIPDLERIIQKIHTLGLKYRSTQHPDGRAIMFEPLRYNRRKIGDLLAALSGFEQAFELVKLYRGLQSDTQPCSSLVERCFGTSFPDISSDLNHFREAFDHKKARDEAMIVPEKGVDREYDEVIENVNDCKRNLDVYLLTIRKRLGCTNIQYFGTGRSRYQIEIPESIAKNLGNEFELKSSRKGYKRMVTDESIRLFEILVAAETKRDVIRHDLMRRVFADFDSRAARWTSVVERVAIFDVLISLARYSQSSGLEMCRPEFVYDSNKSLLDIQAGYHPCLAAKMCAAREEESNISYIPNDTLLGGDHPLTMLLTGPNMGGKSTLMRQVAVLVVLAQIGSFVPAKRMRLSPVDRIFTRIGANDRIYAGQSTFYVELNETKIVLNNASAHSLVVMDELGRGTSTYDGTAIAYAVLRDLAERVQCRTFFSTHYHNLCSAVRSIPNIKLAHMACVVDNENEVDPTLENVTFLYTLSDGICPKSYGFFAAKVSGIKPEVIRNAFSASQLLSECPSKKLSRLHELIKAAKSGCGVEQLSRMIAAM